MATITIKSTYSLDFETRQALQILAQRWGVSKSEVVRRAIRLAAKKDSLNPSAALKALDRLQTSLRQRNVDAIAWARDLKAERCAAMQLPVSNARK